MLEFGLRPFRARTRAVGNPLCRDAMKTCPSCGAQYSDELSFCLQDGTRLAGGGPTNDLVAGPTEEFRPGATNRSDLGEFETLPSQPTVTPQIAAPQTVKQY